jgi:hypothetical protein
MGIEQICVGRCNRSYVKAMASYDKTLTEWMDAEETYPKRLAEWENLAAQMGEEHAGPAPERTERPIPPATRPWYGEPIWCRGCRASIARCLSDLEDLMALRLAMTDGYEQAGHGERVNGSKEARSPSPAQDDLDDMVRWLVGWENTFRESQGARAASYLGVNAPALMTVVSRLLPLLDVILVHADLAAEFGTEIFQEHGRLQRLTTTRPPMKHKPLVCPRCQRLSLFLHDDETIRCRPSELVDCGRIMTAKEYGEYEEESMRQKEAS